MYIWLEKKFYKLSVILFSFSEMTFNTIQYDFYYIAIQPFVWQLRILCFYKQRFFLTIVIFLSQSRCLVAHLDTQFFS